MHAYLRFAHTRVFLCVLLRRFRRFRFHVHGQRSLARSIKMGRGNRTEGADENKRTTVGIDIVPHNLRNGTECKIYDVAGQVLIVEEGVFFAERSKGLVYCAIRSLYVQCAFRTGIADASGLGDIVLGLAVSKREKVATESWHVMVFHFIYVSVACMICEGSFLLCFFRACVARKCKLSMFGRNSIRMFVLPPETRARRLQHQASPLVPVLPCIVVHVRWWPRPPT